MDWDEEEGIVVEQAPICAACGVTALPDERAGGEAVFVCENPDCEAFGEPV
jgi:putative hemolysin